MELPHELQSCVEPAPMAPGDEGVLEIELLLRVKALRDELFRCSDGCGASVGFRRGRMETEDVLGQQPGRAQQIVCGKRALGSAIDCHSAIVGWKICSAAQWMASFAFSRVRIRNEQFFRTPSGLSLRVKSISLTAAASFRISGSCSMC